MKYSRLIRSFGALVFDMGFDPLPESQLRNASTILNESERWNADAIEAQLAHVENNAVRRAYHRADYWIVRVSMMNFWADYLDELHEGGMVIPFRA
jgi:hypothetical protein